MKSPPVLQPSNNDDSEAQVHQARAAGETIIRHHLDNHLAHNTGASSDYISWIATLHPENANVEIDERFLIPGNPWWKIYEETVNMPYATAVPIPPEDDRPHPSSPTASSPTHDNDDKGSVATEPSSLIHTPEPNHSRQEVKAPHFCLRCNPIDMLVGILIAFHAILATFVFELLAIVFYFVASFFYHIANAAGPPNVCTGPFYSLFMVFYFTFSTVDSVLLFTSVLTTELLNLIGWVLGCLFGGIWAANRRHQFVRKVCHHLRWGFRHTHLNPPRSFCKPATASSTNQNEVPHTTPAIAEVEEGIPTTASTGASKIDIEQRTATTF